MRKIEPHDINKSESIRHKLLEGETSAWKRYALLVVGEVSIWKLFKYELIVLLFGWIPGALGLALRKIFYPGLFGKVGHGVVFGRNLVIRNAAKIQLGENVFIDDYALIDARGSGDEGVVIGDNVVLNREVVLISKVGGVQIGSNTDVGMRAMLISTGGIRIGSEVGLAGDCKIGGSMYQLEQEDKEDQGQSSETCWQMRKYSKGPVTIGDQCTIFMQSIILDGVTIGARSTIGANLVLREDVPEETVVAAHQKLVSLPSNSIQNRDGRSKKSADVASAKTKSLVSEDDSDNSETQKQKGGVISGSKVQQLVVSAVYGAVDELNLLRGADQQLAKDLGADLSELDSMDLVNLIVETEQQVEDLLEISINLISEATTTGREVFKTLQTFINEIEAIIDKREE